MSFVITPPPQEWEVLTGQSNRELLVNPAGKMSLPIVYLAANSLMYVALGLWCAASPHSTGKSIGIRAVGLKGMAEYIAVYGGLEFGIGLFFFLACYFTALQLPAMIFAVCFYAGLVIFRSFSIVVHGAAIENGWVLYGFEIFLLASAIYIVTTNYSTGLMDLK